MYFKRYIFNLTKKIGVWSYYHDLSDKSVHY